MAAGEEVTLLQCATERCSLLIQLNTTIETLLARGNEHEWHAFGGLSRVVEDLAHIFTHGLRDQQGVLDDREAYTVFLSCPWSPCSANILKGFSPIGSDSKKVTVTQGKAWLQEALLDRCLLSHLSRLLYNKEHLEHCYLDYAFLRSDSHVQALCTCLQAIERGEPHLLCQVDHILLNKPKYIEQWLKESAEFESPLYPVLENHDTAVNIVPPANDTSPASNSTTSHIEIVYSDSNNSEKEEFHTPSPGSLTDNNEMFDSSFDASDGFQQNVPETGQNFYYVPKDIQGCNAVRNRNNGLAKEETFTAKNFATVSEKRTTIDPLRKKTDLRSTLAHAALSVVLEGDEVTTTSLAWFDGNNRERLYQLRRTSSLNENLLRTPSVSEAADIGRKFKSSTLPHVGAKSHWQRPTISAGTEVNTKRTSMSAHEIKKAVGHNRSKSDQLGVTKTHRQSVNVDMHEQSERKYRNSFSGDTTLSPSSPTGTESLYCNDPFLEDPYEEESLATFLASQDLSSCELDKENAHFSISEALIAAIEQMKCDDVYTSEEEDDEEIIHLKEALEKKRLEKKHERQQAAFSDGTTQSTSSDPSMGTESPKSSFDSDNELGPEWEEITSTDEQLQEYDKEFSTTAPSLMANTAETPAEFTQLHPLSAEAVAKNLLQKFANRKHPAACELQWLVSFQDAPQTLLPLPQTVAVAPDDAVEDEGMKHKPASRQNSLPCRMRGNLEWAPPRAQIIFHAHNPPRRKTLMMAQNFRCAGCGMAVAPDYMKRFRYCHYLGKYFCSSCHNNCLEVIPARVIRKWDFRKYEVSNFARELLNRIHDEPLFNIMDLNSALFKRVRVLSELKHIRRQLHFFGTFIQTCRKGQELADEFSKLPDYICREPSLYSMHSLLQARDGSLLSFLKKLGNRSLDHINQCQLCLAKGFVCEYCKNGDDIIFPFELDRVVQCAGCRASFHKECYVEGKCPKCERRRIRNQMSSEQVS